MKRINKLKNSHFSTQSIKSNSAHNFSMKHTMMLYGINALYSFIPKNACSTLRVSSAIANGCINGLEQGHWIHANNGTFNATLAEAIKINYSFVILRCPFRRLASVFLDKFVAKEPEAWLYRDALQRKIELDNLTFRDFILSLKKPSIFKSNIHWRPQVDFLIYENYSDYFSLEEFSKAIVTLKEKIDFDVFDARELTGHGTNKYCTVDDRCYADMASFDISVLKRSGECPSHASLYDKELYDLVSNLYSQDIELYKNKCKAKKLLNIREVCNQVLDINTVALSDIKYGFEVDYLRDEALKLESTDLKLAFKLMSLAYKARPNRTFVKKKLNEYKELLTQ